MHSFKKQPVWWTFLRWPWGVTFPSAFFLLPSSILLTFLHLFLLPFTIFLLLFPSFLLSFTIFFTSLQTFFLLPFTLFFTSLQHIFSFPSPFFVLLFGISPTSVFLLPFSNFKLPFWNMLERNIKILCLV